MKNSNIVFLASLGVYISHKKAPSPIFWEGKPVLKPIFPQFPPPTPWRKGGGGSLSVFTREGFVVSLFMKEYTHTHTGTCVDGRVCCCLVVVVCVFVLTLTVVRVVVVVVVVGGGVAPKPPRLVWDGCRTSASSM